MYTSTPSRKAIIALGSNLGDRAAHLLQAVKMLLQHSIKVEKLSKIYETAPVDYLDQPAFLNMVAVVSGHLPEPQELLSICLKIEADIGRDRIIPKGPRVIDLDLLIYDDLALQIDSTPALVVPHPRFHLRRFVLVPLVEVEENIQHPVLKKTALQLLKELGNNDKVEVYKSF